MAPPCHDRGGHSRHCIATIVVVAGLIGGARPPAADGRPYIKE
jgi:hypothetical protein